MKIALPVAKNDIAQFKKRNDLLIKFGGLVDHSALIVYASSVRNEAISECERLSTIFDGKIEAVQMAQEPDFNNKMANQNYTFYSVAMHMSRVGNKEPWLLLEADAYPTDYGWANPLQNAQKASGREYFGNIVDVQFVTDGRLHTLEGEKMMMGVGFYSPNMVELTNNMRALVIDLGKPPPACADAPWDIYLRGEMQNQGWASTDLIADQWNTHKYRRVEGGFECEPVPTDRLVRNRGGFVSKKALVVHGCKDDSLYELLMNDAQPEKKTAPIVAFEPSFDKEADLERITKMAAIAGGTSPNALTEEAQKVKTATEERLACGSVRLNVLSDELAIPQAQLTTILEQLGYKIQKPSGWIKKM